MKEFLITVVSVLIISCIFNSIAVNMGIMGSLPPYPWPAGVGELKTGDAAFGTKREDFAYPEINLTSKARPIVFMTEISDGGTDRTAEFPLGANN